MRHLMLDQWSHRSSPVHTLDARAKLVVLLLMLIAISLLPYSILPAIAAALLITARASQLPVTALITRSAFVLPFSTLLALSAWSSGDPTRAAALLSKSYLSALAALLFAATTPFSAWTSALRSWHIPTPLLDTIQFVYRYLFVIAEEAQTMSAAARTRGGFRFSAAAGALAVLFARSWQRAESVHRAMLARGYQP